MAKPWHQMQAEEVIGLLAADPGSGLSPAESARRLEEIGPNLLATAESAPWWRILLAQFQDFMVLVLLAATAISYLMNEKADAITIVIIVILNAILGFLQEYRAERSLEALKQMTAPTARVRRGGVEQQVPAKDLVPGDILVLEAGDRVPADARLLEATGVEAEEAALTGESLPVRKTPTWSGSADTSLGDRRNMLYMGTTLTRGRGLAVVVESGMTTEMGRIAGMIQEAQEEETPLQRRLEQLGKWLVLACLFVCALVVVAGLLRAETLNQAEITRMVLAGVSLAVAAIPEGLPAIVTVALALGVQRMIKRNAIVRKLQAVETLGCASVICSDKTGTLTKNEMMVRAAWAGGAAYQVTGDGYSPAGEFMAGDRRVAPLEAPDLAAALRGAALCSNALVLQAGKAKRSLLAKAKGEPAQTKGGWQVQGDPTEGALVVAAWKAGYRPERLAQNYQRLLEIPFESERRRMSVLVRSDQGETLLHTKGAPDTILELSSQILIGGKIQPLTPELRQAILAENDRMAGQALRVIGIGFRPLQVKEIPSDPDEAARAFEQDIVFVGLMGMIDPPRPEVKRAVQAAHRASIRTVMITGDHAGTAMAVARELGIATKESDRAITGRELDAMSDADLVEAVRTARVFARVSPQHKLRIVRAFKSLGEIVAMTGDGVNDAPAVKEADIGIAMGRTGTDVTKEASAMILSDDNFATIVAAVEEGRGIYDNIRKFIRYLLSCNTGEVLTMFLAAMMRLPLPLLPIQILFVNLVTDGLPAMALGVDPTEPDVMNRPPRRPDEGVFARRLGIKIFGRGTLIGIGTLAAFLTAVWLAARSGVADPLADPMVLQRARTMALATLVCAQLIHVFDCRSERRTIFETGLFGNPWLVAAVASSLSALLLAIYWPPLASIFDTAALTGRDWSVVLACAGVGEVLVIVRRFMMFGVPMSRLRRVEEEA